jgi:Lon protease-like protein
MNIMPVINLPVFPLPVFLLPNGITRLRIFEQRYLKMIQIASVNNGFVIVSKNINIENKSEDLVEAEVWGSWVDIINFDTGEDGVLEIDVKCKNLVHLSSLTKDDDNLHFSDIEICPHWDESTIENETNPLFQSLLSLFEQTPLLQALYKNETTANTQWVIARWLEILPISFEVKELFSKPDSYSTAQEFVQSIVVANRTH